MSKELWRLPKSIHERPVLTAIRYRDAEGKKESTFRRLVFSPGIKIKDGKVIKRGE